MNRREFVAGSVAAAAAAHLEGAIASAAQTERPRGRLSSSHWDYYSFDDFEGREVKRRWYVRGTDPSVSNGRLLLSNRNSDTGTVALKGCYDVRRIYLKGPWAIEAEMLLPVAPEDRIPHRGAIGITVCNSRGMKVEIQAGVCGGFGARWPYYRFAGKSEDDWITDRSLVDVRAAWLRIESSGEDGASVRCAVRFSENEAWTYSRELVLEGPSEWAEQVALLNAATSGAKNMEASGTRVTIAFERVRLEGDSFRFSAPGSIDYIRPNVPPLMLSAEPGRVAAVEVVDTLDLAERCRLALNALIGCADPTADHEIYGMVYTAPTGWTPFDLNYYNPDVEKGLPVMVHDFGDDLLQPKVVEAIPLMRLACGSRQGLEDGERMLRWMRRMVGPDGVVHHPVRGRPWALFAFSGVNPYGQGIASGHLRDATESSYAGLMPGRLLLALGAWFAVTGATELKKDLLAVTVGIVGGDYERLVRKSHPIGLGALIQGLAKCFALTSYQPARDMAIRLAKQFRQAGYYDQDGKFTYHFHTMTFGLLAMLELANATGDRELLDFVRRGYEYARSEGNALVGFFPEGVRQRPATCETCETAEMIALALKLSHVGAGDYWDEADRWIRNQFAENQLLDRSWIEQMSRTNQPETLERSGYDPTRDVPDRVVGWFTSYADANNWFMEFPRAPGLVACCLGNGARALYYAWEHILDWAPGSLRVNLLLNRSSRQVDIESHLPCAGRVDIRVKEQCLLAVRIPGWVARNDVRCDVNGRAREISWDGAFAKLGRVRPGGIVRIRFPVEEIRTKQKIGEQRCDLVVRGSTVVAIDPEAKVYPLYRRARYRTDQTPTTRVDRFVPDRVVEW